MRKEGERKIFRSRKNNILMGVCVGLASYFEIDPTLVRIMFIILTLGGGAGILIYIILALIMPLESNKNDGSVEIKIERENEKKTKKVNFLGVVFLVTGGILLWNQFFPIKIVWEIFWPIVMIIMGLWLILKD